MKSKLHSTSIYVNGKYAGVLSDRELYSLGVKVLRACCRFREEVVLPNGNRICMSIKLQKSRKRKRHQ